MGNSHRYTLPLRGIGFCQIVLTTRCNLACWHCPIAEYRNRDEVQYRLTNERLLPWLSKYINPQEWVIELTGGEPALYEGIEELCQWLSVHNYRVLVKTNGLLPISSYPGVKRVAAFHQLGNPPKYFDEILIVDKIDCEPKATYCKEHGWPYQVIGYNKEHSKDVPHGFSRSLYVDPHGHCVPCPSTPIRWKPGGDDPYTIENKAPIPGPCCIRCKAAIDAWRFL